MASPSLGGSATRALLAGLTALATVGCQTVTTKTSKDGTGLTSAPAPPGSTDPTGPKTDFRREVGPEQQFNVHVEMARVYETQGNNEAAVSEYQKAIDVTALKGSGRRGSKVGPAQQALAQRRMASAFDRMGRFAQAEAHYLKALKLSPDDPKVWNDAGYSYYLQSRWADAERALKTAEGLDPNNPRVQTNLGLTLAAEGKTDDALRALTRAGGPAVGHANLGYILAAMGKTDLARRHYADALKLQPELTAARQAMARLDAPARPTTALASNATPSNPRDGRVARASAPGQPPELPPLPPR